MVLGRISSCRCPRFLASLLLLVSLLVFAVDRTEPFRCSLVGGPVSTVEVAQHGRNPSGESSVPPPTRREGSARRPLITKDSLFGASARINDGPPPSVDGLPAAGANGQTTPAFGPPRRGGGPPPSRRSIPSCPQTLSLDMKTSPSSKFPLPVSLILSTLAEKVGGNQLQFGVSPVAEGKVSCRLSPAHRRWIVLEIGGENNRATSPRRRGDRAPVRVGGEVRTVFECTYEGKESGAVGVLGQKHTQHHFSDVALSEENLLHSSRGPSKSTRRSFLGLFARAKSKMSQAVRESLLQSLVGVKLVLELTMRVPALFRTNFFKNREDPFCVGRSLDSLDSFPTEPPLSVNLRSVGTVESTLISHFLEKAIPPASAKIQQAIAMALYKFSAMAYAYSEGVAFVDGSSTTQQGPPTLSVSGLIWIARDERETLQQGLKLLSPEPEPRETNSAMLRAAFRELDGRPAERKLIHVLLERISFVRAAGAKRIRSFSHDEDDLGQLFSTVMTTLKNEESWSQLWHLGSGMLSQMLLSKERPAAFDEVLLEVLRLELDRPRLHPTLAAIGGVFPRAGGAGNGAGAQDTQEEEPDAISAELVRLLAVEARRFVENTNPAGGLRSTGGHSIAATPRRGHGHGSDDRLDVNVYVPALASFLLDGLTLRAKILLRAVLKRYLELSVVRAVSLEEADAHPGIKELDAEDEAAVVVHAAEGAELSLTRFEKPAAPLGGEEKTEEGPVPQTVYEQFVPEAMLSGLTKQWMGVEEAGRARQKVEEAAQEFLRSGGGGGGSFGGGLPHAVCRRQYDERLFVGDSVTLFPDSRCDTRSCPLGAACRDGCGAARPQHPPAGYGVYAGMGPLFLPVEAAARPSAMLLPLETTGPLRQRKGSVCSTSTTCSSVPTSTAGSLPDTASSLSSSFPPTSATSLESLPPFHLGHTGSG